MFANFHIQMKLMAKKKGRGWQTFDVSFSYPNTWSISESEMSHTTLCGGNGS